MLCVSETWLLPNIPDQLINLPDFNVFRCEKGRGGGACIFVQNSLSVTTQPSHTENLIPGVEDVWVTVQHRRFSSVIVGCIYRHPKAPRESFDYIQDKLRSMCLHKKTFYVLGDLNDDFLCEKSRLKNIVTNAKLSQVVTCSTRTTIDSATLLDVIITNNPDTIIKTDVRPYPIADHDIIRIVVNIRKPKHQPVYITNRIIQNYSSDVFC